jgi:nucleoside-diphosphate-sugar epimerase
MKIFVTGASGFVGGAVASFFVKKGYKVLGMSRSTASDRQIEAMGAVAVRCDLATISPAHIADCNVLIHTAAFLGQWGNYQAFYDVNVRGTKKVLQAARQAGIKKFLHISTESVLIDGKDLKNVSEDYPYPNTPFFYSKTKQLAEQAVREANVPDFFETVCLRPRMIWGHGDRVMLPLMKDAVLQQKFLWISRGQFQISTTHIDNLVHAIDLAIKMAVGGSVYFVTDDAVSTIHSFFTQLLQTQDVQPSSKSLPKWLVRIAAFFIEKAWLFFKVKSRPPLTRLGAIVFSSHCTLDTSRIKNELGYQPVISMAKGMEELRKGNKRIINFPKK